jgi:hypothetical protein
MDAGEKFNPVAGNEFNGPDMDPGDMVVDALLLVRVQSTDTAKSRITVYRSAGMDDVIETGMLQIHAARDMAYWVLPQAVNGDE